MVSNIVFVAIAKAVQEALVKNFNMGSDRPVFFYDTENSVLQYSTHMYHQYYKFTSAESLSEYIQDIITFILGVEYYESEPDPYYVTFLELYDIKEGWYIKKGDKEDGENV